MTNPLPPPGWYPVQGGQRYWDGYRWLDTVKPVRSPTPVWGIVLITCVALFFVLYFLYLERGSL